MNTVKETAEAAKQGVQRGFETVKDATLDVTGRVVDKVLVLKPI